MTKGKSLAFKTLDVKHQILVKVDKGKMLFLHCHDYDEYDVHV